MENDLSGLLFIDDEICVKISIIVSDHWTIELKIKKTFFFLESNCS